MEHSDIEHMAQGYPPAHIAKDSEEVIVWLATQLLATQEQRDALAVECAQYKSLAERFAERADDYKSGHFGYSVFDSSNEFKQHIKTPATDAYLNAVRAEGVDMFISELAELFKTLKTGGKPWQAVKGIAMRAASLASQLRAGEPS